MSLSLRTTILATGCILAIGTSAARAQMPRVFYYPAPGNYATTQGTVNIPAAGYYYNVPLNAVPAPASPAPAQGFTYSNSSSYYPRGGSIIPSLVTATVSTPPPTIPAVGLPRRAAAARIRAATNAPAARMLVATTRTTQTVKPSRRKPMHRIPRSYSPLLAWDAPRCPYWQLEREY